MLTLLDLALYVSHCRASCSISVTLSIATGRLCVFITNWLNSSRVGGFSRILPSLPGLPGFTDTHLSRRSPLNMAHKGPPGQDPHRHYRPPQRSQQNAIPSIATPGGPPSPFTTQPLSVGAINTSQRSAVPLPSRQQVSRPMAAQAYYDPRHHQFQHHAPTFSSTSMSSEAPSFYAPYAQVQVAAPPQPLPNFSPQYPGVYDHTLPPVGPAGGSWQRVMGAHHHATGAGAQNAYSEHNRSSKVQAQGASVDTSAGADERGMHEDMRDVFFPRKGGREVERFSG